MLFIGIEYAGVLCFAALVLASFGVLRSNLASHGALRPFGALYLGSQLQEQGQENWRRRRRWYGPQRLIRALGEETGNPIMARGTFITKLV